MILYYVLMVINLCLSRISVYFQSMELLLAKGYESGGLFRLSLNDACVNSVNHVSQDSETNVWHSRLCHINFGCMTRLAGLNLILKFDLVKGSKCHVCVESKQPSKPHKAAAREIWHH